MKTYQADHHASPGKLSLLLAGLSFLAIACSGSAKISQGNNASASVFQPNSLTITSVAISAETGGYLNVGSAQLKIPSQALDSDRTISAEIIDIQLPGGPKSIGKAIKLKPEGLQFLKPAELEICYAAAEVANLHEGGAQIYYLTEDNQYVAISGNVDSIRHCVTSHIEHFSSYVAAAVAQVPGNTAPPIGGANFLPTTPLAGIPLRVRTTINDVNGGATPGVVVSAFLYYRTVGAASYNKVALLPDDTDDTVTNRYYYLIPASEVTAAGIQYYFQATDNLNITRTSTAVTRTVPAAATALRFNPVGNLQISAGFNRALTLQATEGTTWQNISVDVFSLSNPALGSILRTGPSTVRFNAVGAASGQIIATAGSLAATTNVNVVPGLLTHIEITDMNQVILSGTLELPAGYVYNFDAIGFDSFGNVATILPALTTTGGIGTVNIDLTGAHFTAASSVSTGSIIADISALTDSLNISIYQPPEVTATAPFDNTSGTALNSNVGVSFSHIMDTSTLTTTTTTACTGSLQVSADDFATCVPMVSNAPAFEASNTLAVITPTANLAGLTTYKIRVTTFARNSAGYPLAVAYTTPVGFTTVAAPPPVPQVLSATPTETATNVSVGTSVGVTFSVPMNPVTFVLSQTTACTGTLQLSADDFVTCIPMSTPQASFSAGDTVATLTPAGPLAFNTLHKVRVTTAAQSAQGVSVAATMTAPYGWTTEAAPLPPSVTAMTPVDAAVNVPVNTAISVSFSTAMNTATLNTTSSAVCGGTIQISADNFVTCIPMSAALATMSNGNTTATFTPAGLLPYSATLKVRVTTSVQSSAGLAMLAPVTSSTGWQTLGVAAWAQTTTTGAGGSWFGALQADSTGNLYAVGYILGTDTYTFGPGVSVTGTNTDGSLYPYSAVIVKYDPNGTALWARTVVAPAPPNSASTFNGLTIDATGALYAVGTQSGTATYDYGSGVTVAGTASANNPVIVKYDSNGNAQWARSLLAGSYNVTFYAIEHDGTGSVYVVGAQSGSGAYTYGSGVSISGPSACCLNAILVKYDGNGTAQWARTVTVATSSSSFSGVSLDQSGNIFVAGVQNGNAAFSYGTTVTATSSYALGQNAVLVKYDPLGNAQWARTSLVGSGDSGFGGVAIDSAGNVFVAGAQSGSGSFAYGNGVSISGAFAAGSNSLLIKYDNAGVAQWAKSVTTSSDNSGYRGITVRDNTIFVSGFQFGNTTLNYGNGISQAGAYAAGPNAVVVRYNLAGAAEWASTPLVSTDYSYFLGVAANSAGVFVGGYQRGSNPVTHGVGVTTTGASSGSSNSLIVKFNQQ